MKLQFDQNDLTFMLQDRGGADLMQASAIATVLSEVNIDNLSSDDELRDYIKWKVHEICKSMPSEMCLSFDSRLRAIEENQETINRLERLYHDTQIKLDSVATSKLRWMIFTVITLGISIASLILHI